MLKVGKRLFKLVISILEAKYGKLNVCHFKIRI